jgi:hypothetical protein
MQTIPVRIEGTILEEISQIFEDVTKRAYEIFLHRGGTSTSGLDLEDWLAAEKQLLWKPEVRLTERPTLFVIRLGTAQTNPADIKIFLTSDDLVVQTVENAGYPRLFRAVHFSQPVNPLRVHAVYAKGRLNIIAVKAAASGFGPGLRNANLRRRKVTAESPRRYDFQ